MLRSIKYPGLVEGSVTTAVIKLLALNLLFQDNVAPWVGRGQLRGLFLVLFFHNLHFGLQLLHNVFRAFQFLLGLRCGRRILWCLATPPMRLSDGNINLSL